MQVTIQISDEEIEWINNHLRKSIMMDMVGFKYLTIGDKILRKIRDAHRVIAASDVLEDTHEH